MRYFFWPGVAVVYFGIVTILWEVCVEPELIKRRYQFQIVGVVIVSGLFALFTIGIVLARAPIDFYAYAMRKGNYASGTVIGDIRWDSHFTDLRVAVTNSSDNDEYDDVDLSIEPYRLMTNKASILNKTTGCELLPLGGTGFAVTTAKESGKVDITATRMGSDFDVHDSSGNVYTTLATGPGYRLRCTKLPSHFTLRTVFAVVNVDESYRPQLKAGTWGWKGADVGPKKSPFDVLGPRPSPSTVTIKGKYMKDFKKFSVNVTLPVMDGS